MATIPVAAGSADPNASEAPRDTASTAAHTGWIRYRIHARGTRGHDRWIYAPGVAECGEEEVYDQITRYHESWALHAEHYHIKYFTTELPSAETIRGCIASKRRALERTLSEIATLEGQLAKAQS